MRRPFAEPRRVFLLSPTLLLSIACPAAAGAGQYQTPPQFPQAPTLNTARGAGQESDPSQDEMMRRTQGEAAKKRNIQRQSKLQADSDRIVQLAQELSDDVQPNGKVASAGAVAKKADEIQKLAHNVKERMKAD